MLPSLCSYGSHISSAGLACLLLPPLSSPGFPGCFPPVTAHHTMHSNVCSLLYNQLQLFATLAWKLRLACSCDKILLGEVGRSPDCEHCSISGLVWNDSRNVLPNFNQIVSGIQISTVQYGSHWPHVAFKHLNCGSSKLSCVLSAHLILQT